MLFGPRAGKLQALLNQECPIWVCQVNRLIVNIVKNASAGKLYGGNPPASLCEWLVFDVSVLEQLMLDRPLLILVALNKVWFSNVILKIGLITGRNFLLTVSESFTLVIYEFAIFIDFRQWLKIKLWFDFYLLDTD